jgi:23S rRNA (uracil-5-)-methyltransferase RumA
MFSAIKRLFQRNKSSDEKDSEAKEESAESEEEVDKNFEKPKKVRNQNQDRPSKLFFVDLDPLPVIDDPAEGDPCGLFVDGLNYHWDGPRFEKFLKTKVLVPYTSATKKKNSYDATIRFDNNEDRLKCYQRLMAARFGEKMIYVVPLYKSYRLSQNLCRRIRARALNPGLATADIRDKVTAWWKIPIEKQYEAKKEKYTKMIQKILPEDHKPVEVIPVPNIKNYRNKVEMTVGKTLEGEIVVGFNLGSKDEDVIAPIDNCYNVPECAPRITKKFTEFVKRAKSPVYDRIENRGVWKFIVLRTTESGEIMLVVVTFGRADEEDIENLKKEFGGEVTSLWYTETTKFESFGNDPKFTLLAGNEVIVETLRGLKFDISPLSFFQTNTPGAEILFQKVEDLAEIDDNTTVLDVCCGTGVIGLSLASKAKKVIGIDVEEAAIENAKKNAEKNGITNAEFIAERAEKVLPEILDNCQKEGSRVVVIVDPPRDGLHKNAAAAIRNCGLIKRLIYISCNPESLVRDASKILFADHRSLYPTNPFQPVTYFGVDLFPHTPRLELVMLMERE